MESKKKNPFKEFYNWYLGLLTVLVSLPILAPLLLKLGLTSIAKWVYFVYSFFCHQFASRSIHLFDYQFAWCARDTGIWFGVATVAWLLKFKKIKPIKWYWVIPFMIPMGLDGVIQTVFTILNIQPVGLVTGEALYISNNLARFVTGVIFGVGLSLWLSGMLIQDSDVRDQTSESSNSKSNPSSPLRMTNKSQYSIFNIQFAKIIMTITVLIIGYFGLVTLWDVTSVENKPLGFADSAVKTPLRDFFQRREDAVCPTKGVDDLFSFECFVK